LFYLLQAEEDAAALRAELNSLQQQSMGNPFGSVPSASKSEEQILDMEKEIMDLKSKLQVPFVFWPYCTIDFGSCSYLNI